METLRLVWSYRDLYQCIRHIRHRKWASLLKLFSSWCGFRLTVLISKFVHSSFWSHRKPVLSAKKTRGPEEVYLCKDQTWSKPVAFTQSTPLVTTSFDQKIHRAWPITDLIVQSWIELALLPFSQRATFLERNVTGTF